MTSSINLNNYSFEFTSIEFTDGKTLVYVASHLSYKARKDFNLYKANQLESTFIIILNSKKSNIIAVCLYEHPVMDVNEFNKNSLLDKLSKNLAILILTY